MLLPIVLLVASGAAPPAAERSEKEILICQRETPIGSLIPRRKICLTKAQWVKRSADGNEEARRMAYENMGRPSCTDANSC